MQNAKGNTLNGGQQYKDWISKAPPPQARPSRLHPLLYTWNERRYWNDQLKFVLPSDRQSTLD